MSTHTIVNTTTGKTELIIHTVTPQIVIGEQMISADRRAAKGQELSDSERIRRNVLPANHWGSLSATMNLTPSQALTDILTAGLRSIAADRLRDTLSESPMVRTVSLDDYTVSALLAWSNDTASSRGSITFTREQVEQWFPTSKLFATIASKGKQVTDFVGSRLATLAAKNHGIKESKDANKLVSLLSDDVAADAPLAAELVLRLTAIAKNLDAKKEEKTLSLDDL